VRIRITLALFGCAVLLAITGGLFASLDLGSADQYASVASFFLALIAALGSALSWVRRSARTPDPDAAADAQPGPKTWTASIAVKSQNVQQGPGSVMFVQNNGEKPQS
jgi:hypothetical protein